MALLAIWTPEDGLLGAVAPLGLAAAAGTALVIDLDPGGPRYPGRGSLATLAAEGPRRSDLTPSRPGLAVLRNGGIEPSEAAELVQALATGWPAVVMRLPPRPEPDGQIPVVPVRALVPGDLFGPAPPLAVYQRTGWRLAPPGPGPVLPIPRRSTWASLLAGVLPTRDRWLASWRSTWRLAWA